MNYVTSKIIKRMDNFKVRGDSQAKQMKVLLPLSLGVSSISLLHVLDQQLHIQRKRTSRTGYELHVLFVDHSSIDEQTSGVRYLNLVEEMYPSNTYSAVPLEDVFTYLNSSDSLHWSSSGIPDEHLNLPTSSSNTERFKSFLASLPSVTSKTDLINILRTRIVVEFAKEKGCDYITWGDSTTRLAEKTLSETAKGRGYSLPWQTADGPSPHGVTFNFPMRDLLRKEITTYATLTDPPLTSLIVKQSISRPVSASSKDTTIDDLMSQYFHSVEENFPSVVANVVRTSSRLEAPHRYTASTTTSSCNICGLPMDDDAQGLHGWGGDQESVSVQPAEQCPEAAQSTKACYGCARSILRREDFV
ncbi:MAG: hypothetical protein Q9187_006974 [Circinaria calcarea]